MLFLNFVPFFSLGTKTFIATAHLEFSAAPATDLDFGLEAMAVDFLISPHLLVLVCVIVKLGEIFANDDSDS